MPNARKKEAYDKLLERNKDFYKEFQSSFDKQIVSDKPENGTTRIQLLEKIVHSMNSDIIASNLKYVGNMIESLDEEAIIESKKANS